MPPSSKPPWADCVIRFAADDCDSPTRYCPAESQFQYLADQLAELIRENGKLMGKAEEQGRRMDTLFTENARVNTTLSDLGARLIEVRELIAPFILIFQGARLRKWMFVGALTVLFTAGAAVVAWKDIVAFFRGP